MHVNKLSQRDFNIPYSVKYKSVSQKFDIAMKYKTSQVLPDSAEISQQKNKKEEWIKFLENVAIAFLIYAMIREKDVYSRVRHLKKDIKFTKAKSIEEAIKFGKNNLKIESYSGFEPQDLEVLNWINEGLVNTSNKMKGRLRVPKNIYYTDIMGEDTLAGVITDEGQYYGFLGVNRKYFKKVDEALKSMLEQVQRIINVEKDGTYTIYHLYDEKPFLTLINQIRDYKNGLYKSFEEKIKLYQNLKNVKFEHDLIIKTPIDKIKQIIQSEEKLSLLRDAGIETDINLIAQKSPKEQMRVLVSFLKELKKNNKKLELSCKEGSVFHTIYHEMGHLQDNIPRIKAKYNYKTELEYPKELKEWLDDSEKMKIVSQVSEYSCSGPGEFIAETYAKLINNETLPDEVMKFYRELKGPKIPGVK